MFFTPPQLVSLIPCCPFTPSDWSKSSCRFCWGTVLWDKLALLPMMRVLCLILMTISCGATWKTRFQRLWRPSKFFYSICAIIVFCFMCSCSVVDHCPFIWVADFTLFWISVSCQPFRLSLLMHRLIRVWVDWCPEDLTKDSQKFCGRLDLLQL